MPTGEDPSRHNEEQATLERSLQSSALSRPCPDPASASENRQASSASTSDTAAPQAATQTLNAAAVEQNVHLPTLDTSNTAFRLPVVHIRTPSHQTPTRSPLTAGLHIQTDVKTPAVSIAEAQQDDSSSTVIQRDFAQNSGSKAASSQPIAIEKDGLRSTLSVGSMSSFHSLSPGSAIGSPALAAMTDITPLPSPIFPGDSPGPWKRGGPRPGSAGSLGSSVRDEVLPQQISETSGSIPTRISPTKLKNQAYGSLLSDGLDPNHANPQNRRNDRSHSRNRSLSEFLPEAMHNTRARHVTVSATHPPLVATASHLHRERYLAEQRGLVQPNETTAPAALPTPPPSNRSITESEGDEMRDEEPFVEYLTIKSGPTKRARKYRPIRPLGQGTFSKVVLATNERLPPSTTLNETSEGQLQPKHLVAIKIVQHGPAGGADEERVELGLKREVEILQSISHPSLIHLIAFDWHEHEALLVLNYCPGGDLFDLASQQHDSLTPALVQRMFSELVSAVCYLHSKLIVHRDIKLENVLLNVPPTSLADITSPSTHSYPLITLTDLGLSRTIDPESPTLTTRCGSEDYAAPEILLSQPYDGRQTDAWALGVLLYALMEGRLPFDPPPQRPGQKVNRGRSRAAHRIARCDWIWCKFGDDDGDWDEARGAGWEGARTCVDGLLKKVSRGRLSMDQLSNMDYVREGIQIEGGLRRPHTDDEMNEEEG
ncbi:kinase-like protein [Tothia fuscella]|uniref:Kinase-like protein n=1 Tax=Tothia fuscella TaxID=1048955 RepID=A0A9P4U278_9PEZI|nr:kinase-like protein [Tothia fuscella]